MIATFWICAGLMLYVYAGYPLLARWAAKRIGREVRKAPLQCPLSIVVTAYNEEKSIEAKLDNLVSLDYPASLIEILVVSDSSSDRTDEIVEAYPDERVRLLRVEGRQGKTACQNIAIRGIDREVVVLTDATTQIDPGAIGAIVENFGDPEVGCVSGRLIYVDNQQSLTGLGGTAYWEYELGLRRAETRIGSLVGASGCLYAVRRSAYREIDPSLISDFVIALVMRDQGLRTVLEPAGTCREETLERPDGELKMRVRVALRTITALSIERRFLNPFVFGLFAWQLWSHKVLRYASPLIWLALLAASAWLSAQYWFYLVAFLAQLALFGVGAWAWAFHMRQRGWAVKPYYFLLTNAASLIAILRFLRGDRVAVWKTVR